MASTIALIRPQNIQHAHFVTCLTMHVLIDSPDVGCVSHALPYI